MYAISVVAIRHHYDTELSYIDPEDNVVLINTSFIVSIKPTAVLSEYRDILTVDGTMYRVLKTNPELIDLLKP